jgi:CheY-like chemotaxis protein
MAVILVVDDDKDTCESLGRFLQRSNHVAVCAGDGQRAMTVLIDEKPDLVLLDLKMPEMDGIAFLNIVRSYLRWTALPIIVISGVVDDDVEERALKLGVKKIFRKTQMEFGDLLSAIDRSLHAN